jgi:hypothetical protein
VTDISVMRWREDRLPLRGRLTDEIAEPDDAFGVESVEWLVEHEDRRVAEQGGRQTRALGNAEREGSRRVARELAGPDGLTRLADSATVDTVAPREGGQILGGAAGRLRYPGLEERAHMPRRGAAVGVRATIDSNRARCRTREAEDHSQRRGLACVGSAQDAGDVSRLQRERRSVDCCDPAETRRETPRVMELIESPPLVL